METNIRNKCKAYTSLEQSKKLAEILPIESADMDYIPIINIDGEYSVEVNEWDNEHNIEEGWIPCWSLAALLDVLPEINGVNLKFERVKAEDGYNEYYYHIERENKILIPYSKNPVDACVEMIIKLHEQKLL